jgi:type I restriction enzyme R subunit
MTPEQVARQRIDALLDAAGWSVQDAAHANIHAARGVAIRGFPLPGHGLADYPLYVDGAAGSVRSNHSERLPLSGTCCTWTTDRHPVCRPVVRVR